MFFKKDAEIALKLVCSLTQIILHNYLSQFICLSHIKPAFIH